MKIVYIAVYIIVFGIIVKLIYDLIKGKKPSAPSLPKQKVLSTSKPREGVQVDVLQKGSGPKAASGKKVHVHYTAWLTDGTKVDSSYDKGEIFSFTMGRRQVIPGWEAGMIGMQKGEKRKFTIEPSQAYGDQGKANVPPNATIIFEVELLKIY